MTRQRAVEFTGMRPLSEVLEHNRVMTAARHLSLVEEPEPVKLKPGPEYLYGVRDGEVVAFEIVKRTPKFVKIFTGNPRPPGFRETFTDHLYCYVERDGRGSTGWGPRYRRPIGVDLVFTGREDAEGYAAWGWHCNGPRCAPVQQ